MRKREMNVKIIEQENGAMVFDKSIGVYFQVNHVGKLLLEGLVEGNREMN